MRLPTGAILALISALLLGACGTMPSTSGDGSTAKPAFERDTGDGGSSNGGGGGGGY